MGRTKRKWNYCSVGGVVRVNITSGDDIVHLGELNQKNWTVLSCPVDNLHFDKTTLGILDSDGDGKIRVPEVVAASKWLTDAIKDDDMILKGESVLPLDQIDTDNETGKALYDSAKQILANLGKEGDTISIEDTSDSVAIFAKTAFNGDGIVTPASAGGDKALETVIADCIAVEGSVVDRSGEAGVNAEMVEDFYGKCTEYVSWTDAGKSAEILPYGENTDAAMAACDALKDKVADYFMRCKLIGFDSDVAAAVDVSVEKVSSISGDNLSLRADDIATYPLARPTAEAKLSFAGINPAWQGAFANLKALVLDVDFSGSDSISEEEWNATLAKFEPYRAWKSSCKGVEVEKLGVDRVREIISGDSKALLLALVEQDKALEAQSNAICEVDKLMHLYRDFYKFLKNYVIFSDFYSWEPDDMAMFEAGMLFIDQRCCKLCIKVSDMGQHSDMAGLSGMFLIYCKCTSKVKNETMDIVAVMTAGSIKSLRVGKNAVFYDRDGQDWDATVTKIVDNPINIRQAFWSPYIKFWEFCKGLIDKSAQDKESKMIGDLQATATTTAAAPAEAAKAKPFDIAKFAGIFAAIGMALGYIGSFVTKLIAGVTTTPIWITLLLVVAIMLCISGPSCFIAWSKLRKRNLGPVLNANGWAINSIVPVNILFGATLTSTAEYPKLNLSDPFKKKVPLWKKILRWFIVLVIAAGCFLYFTNRLECIGLSFRPEKIQEAMEQVGETLTEQVQTAVDDTTEAGETVDTAM